MGRNNIKQNQTLTYIDNYTWQFLMFIGVGVW